MENSIKEYIGRLFIIKNLKRIHVSIVRLDSQSPLVLCKFYIGDLPDVVFREDIVKMVYEYSNNLLATLPEYEVLNIYS